MDRSPTLLVLAAGMASRYGSLKQIDGFGPNGETIIDYSVHDAFKAGFGRIVFVIRESIAEAFKAAMRSRFPAHIPIEYVTQELDMLPAGYQVPANRTKPWGTGHAVWVAACCIQEPFAVINGDDFYGYQSFKLAADFLNQHPEDTEYGLVGFRLDNTLSEHGAVSRGICALSPDGYLDTLTEQTHIIGTEGGIAALNAGQQPRLLHGDEMVSMNLMAFKPSVFPHFEQSFKAFLDSRAADLKAEFFLPAVVDAVIRSGAGRVKVLPTPEKWFGVTYPDDKPVAIARIRQLVAEGVYAENLWETLSPQTL